MSRRAPAPYHAVMQDSRHQTKAGLRSLKEIQLQMPARPPGGIGREVNEEMEDAEDVERGWAEVEEVAQTNVRSAAGIIDDAKAVRDRVHLELADVRQLVETAAPALDEDLEASLNLVKSLMANQPELSRILQASLPVATQQAAEQHEQLLQRLNDVERILEASNEDVARAAERYSAENDDHQRLRRSYLADRKAWQRERTELKAEVVAHKAEIRTLGDKIGEMGQVIDEAKAECSTAQTHTVQQALSRVPDPSTHLAIALGAAKAQAAYLDASNSDLPDGITLAVDRGGKTMLLFAAKHTLAVFQFTQEHVHVQYEEGTFSLVMDTRRMILSEDIRTLRLGKQRNVAGWVARNLF